MSTILTCPHCHKEHLAPEAVLGKRVRCNNCGCVFIVAAPASSSGAAAVQEAVEDPSAKLPPPVPACPPPVPSVALTPNAAADYPKQTSDSDIDECVASVLGLPSVTPPPMPPQPPAMQAKASFRRGFVTSNTRTCEWCTKQMPQKATHCPNCGKVRKDIYKYKVAYYTFLLWTCLFSVFLGVLIGQGKYHTIPGTYFDDIKVRRGSIENRQAFEFGEFSVERFVSSRTAMLLLIATAFGFLSMVISHIRVSTNLRTWWWF